MSLIIDTSSTARDCIFLIEVGISDASFWGRSVVHSLLHPLYMQEALFFIFAWASLEVRCRKARMGGECKCHSRTTAWLCVSCISYSSRHYHHIMIMYWYQEYSHRIRTQQSSPIRLFLKYSPVILRLQIDWFPASMKTSMTTSSNSSMPRSVDSGRSSPGLVDVLLTPVFLQDARVSLISSPSDSLSLSLLS